jgi:queuine/archaeosine tRNA-ribosyltransferase
MSDVCVFYASEDRRLVSQLVKLLEKHMTVWWDRRLDEGRWERHVDQQLAIAKLVIVIWSHVSVEKEIVVAEAGRAIRRGKPLLMLRTGDVELPLQVAERSCVDALGWNGNGPNDGIQELLEKAQRIVDPRAEPSKNSRPTSVPMLGNEILLPSFFRSVSSFETQIPPLACLGILELHETKLVLISAYDMILADNRRAMYQTIERMRKRGAFIMMDSGNYEAYRKEDFKSSSNEEGWSREQYTKAISRVPFDLAFCFDNFRTGDDSAKVIDDVVRRTRKDQELDRSKLICPIVHAPTSREGVRMHDKLPEVLFGAAKELRPMVIAVPERELGNGLIERAKSVRAIRNALNELAWYQPLHLLGTGNPWSIAVLSAAGADLFDGLEWCRTIANDENGLLYHFQHYDLFRYQARVAKSPATKRSVDNQKVHFAARVGLHNLEVINNWMERVQNHIRGGTINTFLAQTLGKQYDDLREGLPEVFR